MEATAASTRPLFLLAPSPPLLSTVRLALGVGRRRLVAAGARKKRGRQDGEAGEERVDAHSFNPKAGEVTGPFPEAVLLRKVRVPVICDAGSYTNSVERWHLGCVEF